MQRENQRHAPTMSSSNDGDLDVLRTTHFIGNGPLQTAYNECGEGPVFLMVHGYTGSKLDFTSQLDWFSDIRRVIAYDQRGHGESSNQWPYTFDCLANDLVGLLDELGIASCDLLGHSLGGMVAMRAVLQHPDRFGSVILMDTTAEPLKMWPGKVRDQLGALILEQGCEAMLPMMQSQSATPAAQRGIDYLGEEEHWQRIGTKLSQMDPEAWLGLGDEISGAASVLNDLASLTCPTTIVYGQNDDAFVQPSKAMAALIGNSRLVEIPSAGHSPQYENADPWRDAIREHLLGAAG